MKILYHKPQKETDSSTEIELPKAKSQLLFIVFVTVVSLVFSGLFITPYFLDTPVEGGSDLMKVIVYWAVCFVANTLLLGAFAAYSKVFNYFIYVYSLVGSVLAYARYAYKATLTPMLIDAALHNDWSTTFELLSTGGFVFVSVCLVLARLADIFRNHVIPSRPLLSMVACITLLVVMYNCNFRIQTGLSQRFPVNVYSATNLYLESYVGTEERVNPDVRSYAVQRDDSLTVVVILGESLRSDHLALNGYSRPTTSTLNTLSNLVSLPNIYSEYTYTCRSLQHMLTRADSVCPDYAFSELSFITSLSLEGFRSYWVSNQDMTSVLSPFIAECDSAYFVHPEKSVYVYSDWYDSDMLPVLSGLLELPEPRNLILLHSIGSHWYYNNHCPDEMLRFTPVTNSREVSNCTPDEIVNSYDNTVVATDRFIADVVELLRSRNALLIYQSDHGEALGEGGEWLHANDSECNRNPACLIWYSDEYYKRNADKIERLKDNRLKRYRTDYLYHSVLYGANSGSALIDTAQVIFK